jgi:hypothetical protein
VLDAPRLIDYARALQARAAGHQVVVVSPGAVARHSDGPQRRRGRRQ